MEAEIRPECQAAYQPASRPPPMRVCPAEAQWVGGTPASLGSAAGVPGLAEALSLLRGNVTFPASGEPPDVSSGPGDASNGPLEASGETLDRETGRFLHPASRRMLPTGRVMLPTRRWMRPARRQEQALPQAGWKPALPPLRRTSSPTLPRADARERAPPPSQISNGVSSQVGPAAAAGPRRRGRKKLRHETLTL